MLTTVSDRKIGVYSNGSLTLPNDSVVAVVDYYEPHMVNATDYYAFGMPSRVASSATGAGYRHGFNGKENDNEVKGYGNQQDYGMRIYDNRLGRFLSVDPLQTKYPWFTPYQFAGNGPIANLDLDGLEDYNVSVALDDKGHYMSNSGPEFRAGYFQQWLSDAFGINMPKTYYVVALRGSTEIKVDKNGGSNIIGAWKVGSYGNVQKFISDEGYRNQVMGTPDVVQKQQLESEQWLEEYNTNLRAGLGAKFVLDRNQTKQQTPASAVGTSFSVNQQATRANSGNTLAAESNTATIYRTQGGTLPNASQQRIQIGKDGSIKIEGDQMLYVTINDKQHQVYFYGKRGGSDNGAYIASFKIPQSLADEIKKNAVPQAQGKAFPNNPQISDPTKSKGAYGLPKEYIKKLQEQAVQGTGQTQTPNQ